MNTERTVAWILFVPTLIGMLFPINPFEASAIELKIFWISMFFWSMFMCFSFFSGLAALINPGQYEGMQDYRKAMTGMNLWLLIIPWMTLSESGGLVMFLAFAHLFNFLLHLSQTKIFKNA